jgi:hypothetical protein
MEHTHLFYTTYALQIAVISVIVPLWISQRLRQMLSEHPPADYPKLYPVSPARIDRTLSTFAWLNALVVLMGLAILGHVVFSQQEELLGWDNQGALIVYFLLQYLPFVYLGSQGFRYHQMMRQLNSSARRQASLHPRTLSDYVPKTWFFIIGISALAYVGTVVYIAQQPFEGFAGYWNILYVCLLNLFFWVMIRAQLSGRKQDPHQSHHDRLQQQRLICQVLVIGWLMANLFLTTNMWLAKLDMRDLNVVIQSLYFTVITLLMSQTSTHQPTDYSVYQNQPEEAR